jgi:N-acetylglucosaminyldiphosphoundecaprenol N-acetyl-beta-D-mannosaminyltransferase
MLFGVDVLREHPWEAFSRVEDLEYSIDLRLAGVVPVFAGDARLRAPIASGGAAYVTQRRRWEGGRLDLVRSRMGGLLRAILRGRVDLIAVVVDLAVPPLGLLGAAGLAGLAVTLGATLAGAVPAWVPVVWLIADACIAGFVLIGFASADAPARAYSSLAMAPLFVLRKVATAARLIRDPDRDRWVRTERPSEERGRGCVGGVPIDALTMDDVVARIVRAAHDRSALQVCTVNLDYLVTAQRENGVAAILASSGLNLADGAPLVWLARLAGRPIPARITGADLVPALAAAAAREHLTLALVGGEQRAAQTAADALLQRNPGLSAVAFEPEVGELDALVHSDVATRVAATKPAIVLVALGHPKQDRWIAAERDRLGDCVAIGVGASLDFLAGRSRRAPRWMQRSGTEWLWRVLHEPTRLGPRYLRDGVWLLAVLIPRAIRDRFSRGKAPFGDDVPPGSLEPGTLPGQSVVHRALRPGPDDMCRISDDDAERLDQPGDHRAGSDDGTSSDPCPGEDHRPHPDPHVVFDHDTAALEREVRRTQVVLGRDDCDLGCDRDIVAHREGRARVDDAIPADPSA